MDWPQLHENGLRFHLTGDELLELHLGRHESPLIFMPEDNNLVFSGTIPSLNNLKWQFKLRTNTGDGCFIWSDGLIINEKNLKTLNKLQGFYENWKNDWQAESGDLERMAKALTIREQ